jgi:proline iminopeptidase
MLLTTIAVLAVLSCGLLVVFGSPSPREPGFIKAMRFNMWAETLGLLGYSLRNPRLLSVRATEVEKQMPLPGDELVPTANACATYAITIAAPAERVWPWLVQMGYGRALWYAWSPMHAYPEYQHHISTAALHPEWQNLHVGDVLLDGGASGQCSENRGAWRVMQIQAPRLIVFFSARDFIEGIEFDPRTTRPGKIYAITSWVFYIDPINEMQSRLLIRTRAELGPGMLKIAARLVFGGMDAVFERTILEGIKSRVENYARASGQAVLG